jgi:hypothetical protein
LTCNRETVLVPDSCKPSIHLSGIPTIQQLKEEKPS